jgi:cytochrome P450
MSERPPVTDWATDFDHFDPEWTNNPYAIWDELRQKCPVATSQRFEDGAYLPTSYADIYAIAYDTENFSSRRAVMREKKLPLHLISAPPITSDPPEHTPARRLLLPPFSQGAVELMEPSIRESCRALLDELGERDQFDASMEYARHIPSRVMAQMFGLDLSLSDTFHDWIYRILIEGIHNPMATITAIGEQDVLFKELIALRTENPGDDLVSYLLKSEYNGEPMTESHITGTLRLLLIAGIDTTWGAIGSSIWHLATHPEDRRRLVAEPELMPTAIEEFLRAYSPSTHMREVVNETTISGCTYKPLSQVLLSYPAANRDPAKFENPDTVIMDRADNQHAAFGLGRHRCLGAPLARLEIRIALEEWLKRFPDFEETTGQTTTWSAGTVRGPRILPITILKRA